MSATNHFRPATSDAQRPDPIIDSHYARLYKAVSEFTDESGIARDIEVLASVLNGWLNEAIGADKIDQTDPNRTYPVRDHHLNMIFSVTQMMVNVARIKEAWRLIEQAEKVNQPAQ